MSTTSLINNLKEIFGTFQYELIIASFAGVTIVVLEQGLHYYSNMLRRIKKAPSLTPSRLEKKGIKKFADREIVMQGKAELFHSTDVLYLEEFNRSFKIVNPRDDSQGVACIIPFYASFFNARHGPIENTNMLVNFAVDSFEMRRFVGVDKDGFIPIKPVYMLDSDQVTVFGKLSRNYSRPHMTARCLSLGGVDSMIKSLEEEIYSTRKIQLSLGVFPFYFVVKMVVNGLLWLLNRSKNPKLIQSIGNVNKCAKCNNKKNLLLLDCMHFDLCFKCYKDLNFTCSLCKRRMGYISFVENN